MMGIGRKDLRIRVERLLAGQLRESDLYRLMLSLRQRTTPAHETLREVGDFAAHQDERDKGGVFYRASTWAAMLPLNPPYQRRPGVPDSSASADAGDLKAAIDATFAVAASKGLVKTLFGVTVKDGQKTLDNIKAKLQWLSLAAMPSDPPHMLFEPDLSKSEAELFFMLCGQAGNRNCYTGVDLISEFIDRLRAEGLLLNGEELPERSEQFVVVYAIAKMHGATLALPYGWEGELTLGTMSDGSGRLAVFLTALTHNLRIRPIRMIMTTDLQIRDWAAAELIPRQHGPVEVLPFAWHEPIDINEDGLLISAAATPPLPFDPS